jgi:L-rhamnose mutarotase
MIRRAFVMQVHPDQHAEYERRHRPIWEELAETLRAHGAHNYSIFLHAETSQLFAYVELEDEARWNAIAETEVCRRWWKHMADVMETNVDSSPKSTPLVEVFHLN